MTRSRTKRTKISQEERSQWIAKAAYYRSRNQPSEPQDSLENWLQAEREIDALTHSAPSPSSKTGDDGVR